VNTQAILNRFFYHGGPCRIDRFSYEFTGKGDDRFGSGFYFITNRLEANRYCYRADSERRFKVEGDQPTLHKVKISMKNPMLDTTIRGLTELEVGAIIMRSPIFIERLADYGEIEFEGLDTVIGYATSAMANDDKEPLINTLNVLSSDFFGEHIEAFNTAVKKVLGYDGLLAKAAGKDWFAIAWFPEQIEIVETIAYRPRSHDNDNGAAP
jgi:hypothetical protein